MSSGNPEFIGVDTVVVDGTRRVVGESCISLVFVSLDLGFDDRSGTALDGKATISIPRLAPASTASLAMPSFFSLVSTRVSEGPISASVSGPVVSPGKGSLPAANGGVS